MSLVNFGKSALTFGVGFNGGWSMSLVRRGLHANRAAVCRIRRSPGEYTRLYPTRIVFKDGSTVVVRHQVPREIIKLPLLLEECGTEAERRAWQRRRKPKEVIEIKKDDIEVSFDHTQYLKTMQMAAGAKKKTGKTR